MNVVKLKGIRERLEEGERYVFVIIQRSGHQLCVEGMSKEGARSRCL